MNKLTDKRIIIFGAGILGKQALGYFGSRNVECFVDNNKAGEFYCGKNIIPIEKLCLIQEEFDLVVAVARRLLPEIEKQLISAGISDFCYYYDLLSIDDFESDPMLAALKNTHLGEKCFIIGNGPSLKASDLDVLYESKAFSFAANRIFKIFDQTKWRPDVYCVGDSYVLNIDLEHALRLDIDLKLFLHPRYTKYGEEFINPKNQNGNTLFFSHISKPFNADTPLIPFSDDPSRCVCSGYTIVYSIIQWAAYMGFTEMYLLGVDNDYTSAPALSVSDADADHFSKDYTDVQWASSVTNYNPVFINIAQTQSYESAEIYSREHGFRIFNATRGGKLEAFERVDFGSLFE